MIMPRNRFEKVDEQQTDAITLKLWKEKDQTVGTVTCPAELSSGKLAADQTSETLPAKDAYRSAIRLANTIKAPIVVLDPQALWEAEWGDLYRAVD
jgi:hypothetical protein